MYVPIIKPAKPTIRKKISFATINLNGKPLSTYFQYVQNSMIAGNPMPTHDIHSAPTSEINSPSFGIATAKRTTRKGKHEI